MAGPSRRSQIYMVGIFVVAVLAIGCGGGDDSSPTSPTVNVPFSQTDLRVGTGTEATTGRNVTVHHTGWLYDPAAAQQKGRQFDSSAGRPPYTFRLGAGEVIRGWDQGFGGMRVGGLRRLVIPPDLAYGSTGGGGDAIPPNATLVFEIELLAVQ
jgi:FKBP-type peptidyl-prolyl cis-trans isomerase FkpA